MEEVQLQFLLDVTDKDSNNNNLSLSERMYRHALNRIMRTFQKLQKILLFLEKEKPIVTPSPGDESPPASVWGVGHHIHNINLPPSSTCHTQALLSCPEISRAENLWLCCTVHSPLLATALYTINSKFSNPPFLSPSPSLTDGQYNLITEFF